MTSECPNCGKTFPTAKGMKIHKADCKKKDPYGIGGMNKKLKKQMDEQNKQIRKILGAR